MPSSIALNAKTLHLTLPDGLKQSTVHTTLNTSSCVDEGNDCDSLLNALEMSTRLTDVSQDIKRYLLQIPTTSCSISRFSFISFQLTSIHQSTNFLPSSKMSEGIPIPNTFFFLLIMCSGRRPLVTNVNFLIFHQRTQLFLNLYNLFHFFFLFLLFCILFPPNEWQPFTKGLEKLSRKHTDIRLNFFLPT